MQNNAQSVPESGKKGNFWMFFIPSLIGLFLFMAPITFDGGLTIPVAVLAKSLQAAVGDFIVPLVTAIIAFMAVASVVTRIAKPAFINENDF